uniref:Pentatricopeptide repeat-containing protein n=1 Tax=Nelumbo nucifera TaxID=4432 RepID=A0A822Y1M4_NELNU|nr:TPA_asm: hypothetical protein HUJ06_029262 [Nelumbo nucifera]
MLKRWPTIISLGLMRLFDSMRMRSNGSTIEAVTLVLSVCANSYSLDKGKEIHGYVIMSRFQDYAFVQNSLISMYGKHGDIEDTKKIFSEIKVKSLMSRNAMISSYVETGFCDKALEIFSYLENTEDNQLPRPNLISWSTLIDGLSSQGWRDESLELFRQCCILVSCQIQSQLPTFISLCRFSNARSWKGDSW